MMIVVVMVMVKRSSSVSDPESSSLVIIFKRVLGYGINSLRSIARIINSLLIIKTWMDVRAFMGNLNAR